ncbi:MAG: hypothetical protein E7263_10345 [Lachnospiraceae bacterium]|nr:hypothetical protein [Lachnospiraceae bacterium]
MRITTQMLNQSAKRSGLDINRPTLLDYMKNNNMGNPLYQALSKNRSINTNSVKLESFEKLEEEAGQLTELTQKLLNDGEKSVFEQAKVSGDNQEIYNSIENMFDGYNRTLKSLRTTSNTMNDFYRKMLMDAPEETRAELEKLGITFDKDGSADVDISKLKTADYETLEKNFGKDSDLVNKLEFIASRISDNAKANVESMGNGYNASGTVYGNSINSKYDFSR